MRDTFLRKSKKDQEGVGSIFEGIECGPFHQESKETPDKDYVCNFTELSINPSMRSIFGCDKIDVEMDLIIRRFPDFPGYVEVIHGDDTIPNVSIYASYRAHRRLTERRIVKTTKNGPAYSIYDKYLDNKISKIDIVNCLAYHSWPVEANKWVSRNKPNNWPSYKLIETIKSKGFTLAPVGHFDCVDKDYQWRIGIRGEKELLLNLNETQVLCYVALRLILKDDIKLIDKDVLSSYHMKHVVFWCVEKGSCRWTNDNFKICLQTCINNLIAFIKNRTFPHYFIEDRNLINSKMTPNLKNKIVESLTKYSSNVLAILCLRSFDRLKNLTLDFDVLLLKCVKERYITQTCIMFYSVTLGAFYIEQHLLWETYNGHDTLSNLQNAQCILSTLENTKRLFISPYTAYAKSMLGLLHYSRFHETGCKNDNLKAGELLRSSVTFEHVVIQFRFATFCFMKNEFKECLGVCNAFLNNPSKYKTLHEKEWQQNKVFQYIRDFLNLIGVGLHSLTVLEEIKEKICAIFYDKWTSEKCGDGRLQQAKMFFSPKSVDDVKKMILELYKNNESSCEILLMIYQNIPNVLFADMGFNVPYLASEKWAVPDVIQYELLSVQKCHPESCIYGIYIDPMLNCLVLSFLSYQETNNLTQRDEILMKMDQYIKEYSYKGQPIAAELPHSLPLYRVYNIVAYCFLKAGRYQQAIMYILNSLKLYGNKNNTAYGYVRCAHLYVFASL